MQILILIEPKTDGGYRATAGEPFRLSAEAASEQDAARQLEAMLRTRLNGSRLAVLELENGTQANVQKPLHFEPIEGEDWFFDAFNEAIAENRRREDEAEGITRCTEDSTLEAKK